MPRLEAAPSKQSSAAVECGTFESPRHKATRRGNILTSATSANERGKFIIIANQRASFAYATNHPLLTGRVHGRGRHSAAQRTCARRAGRPTWSTGGRVGSTAARRGFSSRAARWRQKPPTSRRNRSRRAGTITHGSSQARRTPKVAASGRRAQVGAVGGGMGANAVRVRVARLFLSSPLA